MCMYICICIYGYICIYVKTCLFVFFFFNTCLWLNVCWDISQVCAASAGRHDSKTCVQFDFAVKKELKTQKLNTSPFTKCFSFNYDKVNTYIIKKYMRENVVYFISFVWFFSLLMFKSSCSDGGADVFGSGGILPER